MAANPMHHAAWSQVRDTAMAVVLLMFAIILAVFLVLSVTAVEKPLKTNAEYEDDEDAHRRGAALGRRKVGGVDWAFVIGASSMATPGASCVAAPGTACRPEPLPPGDSFALAPASFVLLAGLCAHDRSAEAVTVSRTPSWPRGEGTLAG